MFDKHVHELHKLEFMIHNFKSSLVHSVDFISTYFHVELFYV